MKSRLRVRLAALTVACLTLVPGASPTASAAPGDTASYVSGGTAAARANGQTVVDEGTVVCDDGNGVGVGGFCLGFGGGDAVQVADATAGENVAFQVCVDNSGDGVCTSPDFGACADVVVFSHDDDGSFYNPVGPVPTGFAPGCAGGPWRGYVVFLCDGAHLAGADGHSHPATSGTGGVVSGGEGQGTFCGGTPIQQSRKPYTLGSGARYMSGGTAVVREDGQTTADEGSVVCNNGDNVGVGGFCVPFTGGNAVAVFDASLGEDVPFQVCVDNSGDGLCTSPESGPCADVIAFSHNDAGQFFNPLGPVPTGFAPGCGGGPWNGFVVFLCEGAHVQGGVPHPHTPTTGTGRVTTGGEGLGTFCGGSHAAPSRKRYTTRPDADRLCQLGTSTDSSPEAPESTQTGFLSGGPVNRNGTLKCTVKVGVSTHSGAFANGASRTVSGTNGVTVLAPGLVSFIAPEGVPTYLCAQFTEPDGSTLYFDDTTGAFSPDPDSECGLNVDVADSDPALDPAKDAVAPLAEQADVITCPLLAPLTGSYGVVDITAQGDVFVAGEPVVDCPPYDLGGTGPAVGGARVILGGVG
ncbi:MAG TPA: hypothetical protein VNQ77_03100 [Frankiaceae bacterium]|nr:hypothetical protein [Frankiaceae bacterium]